MNKTRKNKHYQISLYIQSRNKTFLLFLFCLQLFSSNAWPLTPMPFVSLGFSAFRQERTPPISSPVLKESHPRESGRFGEKVRAKAFPSGLSLANALWSVLGQRRAGHGGDSLSRGSSSRHLYAWKLGRSTTWLASRDAEDAKCSSVFGAEGSSPLSYAGTLKGGSFWGWGHLNWCQKPVLERLCEWSSMSNAGTRFHWCRLFHLGQGR